MVSVFSFHVIGEDGSCRDESSISSLHVETISVIFFFPFIFLNSIPVEQHCRRLISMRRRIPVSFGLGDFPFSQPYCGPGRKKSTKTCNSRIFNSSIQFWKVIELFISALKRCQLAERVPTVDIHEIFLFRYFKRLRNETFCGFVSARTRL